MVVLEEAAAVHAGRKDWEANFKVASGGAWSPEHEVMSRRGLGPFVYLTVQILAIQTLYHSLSLLSEALHYFAGIQRLQAAAYRCAPVVQGMGMVTFFLFVFFAMVSEIFIPHWREQVRVSMFSSVCISCLTFFSRVPPHGQPPTRSPRTYIMPA